MAWHNGQTSWAVDAHRVIFLLDPRWLPGNIFNVYFGPFLVLRCYWPFLRNYYVEINVAWHNDQTSWAVDAHRVNF